MHGETGDGLALPCRVAHTFQVESDTARFLTVVAGRRHEPSFVEMVHDLGTELPEGRLPEPVDIDPGQRVAACARHGVEVLGPPPAAHRPGEHHHRS